MMELPYLAAFYVTRGFLPEMLARGSGHVVNVSLVASYLVWPSAAGYFAARQALKDFIGRADRFGRQVEVNNGEVIGQLRSGTCANDWDHRVGVPSRPNPLEWNLVRLPAFVDVIFCQCLQGHDGSRFVHTVAFAIRSRE